LISKFSSFIYLETASKSFLESKDSLVALIIIFPSSLNFDSIIFKAAVIETKSPPPPPPDVGPAPLSMLPPPPPWIESDCYAPIYPGLGGFFFF